MSHDNLGDLFWLHSSPLQNVLDHHRTQVMHRHRGQSTIQGPCGKIGGRYCMIKYSAQCHVNLLLQCSPYFLSTAAFVIQVCSYEKSLVTLLKYAFSKYHCQFLLKHKFPAILTLNTTYCTLQLPTTEQCFILC